MASRKHGRLTGFLKTILLILAGLLVLLSILPYLVPLRGLEAQPASLAFDNSHFVNIEGIKLHYRVWLPGSDAARGRVFMVHGFGASTFSWRYTASYLAEQGYAVIAADLPGFGLSERISGFDHQAETRAALMWALLDQVEPGVNWHLVGHSMGGATVSTMALQRPDQATTLTLAAGAVLGRDETSPGFLLVYPPLARWITVISANLLFTESRVEELLLSAYGRSPNPEEVQGYYLPLTIYGTDLVLVDLLRSRGLAAVPSIEALTLPVLCLWGELDAWVPLAQGQAAADIIPGAKLIIIPGEGHCPMETEPKQFNRELYEFIHAAQCEEALLD